MRSSTVINKTSLHLRVSGILTDRTQDKGSHLNKESVLFLYGGSKDIFSLSLKSEERLIAH